MSEVIKSLAGFLEEQNQEKRDRFEKFLSHIAESHDKFLQVNGEMKIILEGILNREQVVPELKIPETQKVAMEQPTWWNIAPQDFTPLLEAIHLGFDSLRESLQNEHGATRDAIYDTAPVEIPEEIRQVKREPMNLGSIRRHSRWQRARLSDGTITSAGDGFSYYLPSAPILNSETVRLNGGLPLSAGEDYTMTGNVIKFTQMQTNPVLEVRYQS